MYCILITCIWTGSKKLFSVIYESETEAVNAINSLPYSSKNNTFEVKELARVCWAL